MDNLTGHLILQRQRKLNKRKLILRAIYPIRIQLFPGGDAMYILFLVGFIAGLVSCTQKNSEEENLFKNRVTLASDQSTSLTSDQGISASGVQTLSEAGVNVQVSTLSRLQDGPTLIIGYPLGLIGESNLFGAVVTKISPKDDESYGGIKMGHFQNAVRTQLRTQNDLKFIDLLGCREECGETADVKLIATIPILQVDESSQMAKLDLSVLAQSLNIVSYIGDSEFESSDTEKWEHQTSRVVTVEFSYSTLVVDIDSEFKHTQKDGDQVQTTDVKMTSRWYLRLSSAMSPYFEVRKPVAGVGYFQTNGDSSHELIRRFGIYDLKSRPIKYFIKNVPVEFRAAFAGSFEDWNSKLYPVLGRNLFTYEFIDKSDSRYDKIVTGDIRYNVMEWDLDNVAGYGGLGPSISHPLTGETLAGQVLIQGPKVLELYRSWFKLPALENLPSKANLRKTKMSLQNRVEFFIPSQDPRYHDPLAAANGLDFIEIPEGFTYDSYMDGYFRDMVAHELGHNLGLRHNFRGNLGDTGTSRSGSVSRSIMEYLNRGFRHLDRVGDYDVMAIAYGYLGIQPAHSDWYCTDEDSSFGNPTHSAECSSSDATSDPFSFLEGRMNRVVDKLLNRGSTEAPSWTYGELEGVYPDFLSRMAQYAVSAPFTAASWTNFFGKADRPNNAVAVPEYVMKKIATLVCDENLDKAVQSKSTEEARALTAENLKKYRQGVLAVLEKFNKPWPLVSPGVLSCLYRK